MYRLEELQELEREADDRRMEGVTKNIERRIRSYSDSIWGVIQEQVKYLLKGHEDRENLFKEWKETPIGEKLYLYAADRKHTEISREQSEQIMKGAVEHLQRRKEEITQLVEEAREEEKWEKEHGRTKNKWMV